MFFSLLHNQKKRYNGKRILSAITAAALVLAMPVVESGGFAGFWGEIAAYAKTAQELKEEAEQNLNDTNNKIDEIEGQQQEVQNKLDQAADQLTELLAKQDKLKAQITETQKQVAQANKDLDEAIQKEAEEYDSMKLRIQYMYENGSDISIWSAIFESKGFSDMLNQIEYVTAMYKSDRELLDAYQEEVQRVKDLTQLLNDKMEELLSMQDDYRAQQEEVEELIASLEDQKETYAAQLAAAQAQKQEYQDTITEQGRIIQQQEAEAARRAEEEERRRREQQLAQQQAQQQAQQEQQNSSSESSSDGSDYEGGGSGAGGLGSDESLTDDSANPTPSTDISGEDIVSYAKQFEGNPYVWGGNSLTNGCDCSGFVHLIYKHFGISTPRYSQAFRSVGKAVSYANIQPGDVVVYPGHVAIYAGGGVIVEAQSSRAGITCGRSVDCHTILAIRRLV